VRVFIFTAPGGVHNFQKLPSATIIQNKPTERKNNIMNKKAMLLLGVVIILGGAFFLFNAQKEKAGNPSAQIERQQPASKPESPTG
jgi:uncharacterized membrane protein